MHRVKERERVKDCANKRVRPTSRDIVFQSVALNQAKIAQE